jgi:peroxiredoxin
MKRNGMYALDFNAPAVDGGQLIYLRGKHLMGRLVVLCFLPDAGLRADEIDHHTQRFQKVDATLVIVSSGVRPLHRLWVDPPAQPSTIVLADPCGRLRRLFGVRSSEIPPRCQTFVIDREGTLRLRLTHDFVGHDLETLRTMIGSSNMDMIDGHTAIPIAGNIETGYFAGVITRGD